MTHLEAEIPEDVRRFLREQVEGYEQLELLLLLQRTPGRTWTAEQLAAELRIPDTVADPALSDLARRKILLTEGEGRAQTFHCRPELKELMQRLAQTYDQKRLEVIQLMNAYSMERVRTAAARAFADAFVLGGKK